MRRTGVGGDKLSTQILLLMKPFPACPTPGLSAEDMGFCITPHPVPGAPATSHHSHLEPASAGDDADCLFKDQPEYFHEAGLLMGPQESLSGLQKD